MSNITQLAFGTDTARARRTDPAASHEAADISAAGRDNILGLVRDLLIEAGTKGLTDRELTRQFFARHADIGCDLSSPRKRRSDLTRDGEAIVTSLRRKTGSEKVAQHVWVHRYFASSYGNRPA